MFWFFLLLNLINEHENVSNLKSKNVLHEFQLFQFKKKNKKEKRRKSKERKKVFNQQKELNVTEVLTN